MTSSIDKIKIDTQTVQQDYLKITRHNINEQNKQIAEKYSDHFQNSDQRRQVNRVRQFVIYLTKQKVNLLTIGSRVATTTTRSGGIFSLTTQPPIPRFFIHLSQFLTAWYIFDDTKSAQNEQVKESPNDKQKSTILIKKKLLFHSISTVFLPFLLISFSFHQSRKQLFYGFWANAIVAMTAIVTLIEKMDDFGLESANHLIDNQEVYKELFKMTKIEILKNMKNENIE